MAWQATTQMSEREKVEQIVGECFVKAATIIVGSRVEEPPKSLGARSNANKRKWFNLEIGDWEFVQAEASSWKTDYGFPLVIEIHEPILESTSHASTSRREQDLNGRLLESWTIEWHSEVRNTKTSGSRLEIPAIYKRLVIMLRSLFTYTRVLPAFKIFKAMERSGKQGNRLQYRVCERTKTGSQSQHEKQRENEDLKHYTFTAIETPFGSFKMRVSYLPASSLRIQEATQHQDTSPNVIPNYVGKPRSSLSESLSSKSLCPEDNPAQDLRRVTTMHVETSAQSSGSMHTPFIRRHSWSLSSARSQDIAAAKTAPIPATQKSTTHSTQANGRSNRMGSFAPGTPGTPLGSSATPPKHPNSGLATRMSQALTSTASKVYAYSQGSSATISRSPLHTSSRSSPQRFDEREMRRMSRQASPREQPSSGTPESGVSPSQHSTSKPVGIPSNHGPDRKLRSSEDLRRLERAEMPIKAASARRASAPKHGVSSPVIQTHFGFNPSVSLKTKVNAEKPIPSPFASSPSSGDGPHQPSTPAALYALPSLGSESNSSIHSSVLMSGSPQLPFACTPSKLSCTDQGNNGVQRKESSAMQSSGLGLESSTQPPTPWSARSSGLENGNAAFSLSTMLDSLGSSMFSSSAHAYNLPYSLQSQSVSPRVDALGQESEGQVGTKSETGRNLTPDQMQLMMEDPDHESLPFALDQEIVNSAALSVQGEVEQSFQDSGAESDAAVGAFVQLIQDAPPLQRSIMPANQPQSISIHTESEGILSGPSSAQSMTVQAGLDQLAKLRMQIS